MNEMTHDDILKNLPHRYPMLLVDKVISIEPNKCIVALKNVSANEPYFIGHFPEYPIMPGVLILEALAQAAGLLIINMYGHKYQSNEFLFAGVKNIRFKAPVRPGDQLILTCSFLKYAHKIAKCSATAQVGDNVVATVDELTLIYKEK
jgi:3-hydroxyacyl-[acyl-carrier-protein] dehydratase